MENKFTEKEAQFLRELLGQLNLKPMAPDAIQTVEMVQDIARKIDANTETLEKAAGQ